MVHVTSPYNVEASINAYFADQLTYLLRPDYMPTMPALVYDWPEIEASLPCFSFIHLPASFSDDFMGRVETVSQSVVEGRGMLEISAWVSRDQLYSGQSIWMAQLRWMQSMVAQVYATSGRIVIEDYAPLATSPSSTRYLVTLTNMSTVQTAKDPNPAIERRRMLLAYMWHLRA